MASSHENERMDRILNFDPEANSPAAAPAAMIQNDALQDELLDHRLEYDPETGAQKLASSSLQPALLLPKTLPPIPWPEALRPQPQPLPAPPDPNLPLSDTLTAANVRVDVLVVTWTVAEALALSDVLTPGFRSRRGPSDPADGVFWYPYKHNWAQFKTEIKGMAPALGLERLGLWFLTRIGDKTVMCMKSELHMARDGAKMPVKDLWKQLIAEVKPALVITTGTAGGIGGSIVLGDVVVSQKLRFFCKRTFKGRNDEFRCPQHIKTSEVAFANKHLLTVAQDKLPPASRPAHILTRGQQGIEPLEVVSTDFFAFDDKRNSYELQGKGAVVEMGDATLGLACSELGEAPAWVAIRNASDPQIDGGTISEEADVAGRIYEKFGYWTTVNSAIACWAVIAST